MPVLVILPLLAMLAAAWLGATAAQPLRRHPWALVCGGVWTAVVLTTAATTHDRDVSTTDFVEGLALAAAAMGVFPYFVYYWLGRALTRHRTVLAAGFVVSVAPLYFYLFLVEIWTLSLTHCPPNAYECPL